MSYIACFMPLLSGILLGKDSPNLAFGVLCSAGGVYLGLAMHNVPLAIGLAILPYMYLKIKSCCCCASSSDPRSLARADLPSSAQTTTKSPVQILAGPNGLFTATAHHYRDRYSSDHYRDRYSSDHYRDRSSSDRYKISSSKLVVLCKLRDHPSSPRPPLS